MSALALVRTVAGKDLRTLWTSPLPYVAGAVLQAVLGLLVVDQLAVRDQAVLQPLTTVRRPHLPTHVARTRCARCASRSTPPPAISRFVRQSG